MTARIICQAHIALNIEMYQKRKEWDKFIEIHPIELSEFLQRFLPLGI
jgi:hypothetical protein